MLQPHAPKPLDLKFLKIVWIALNCSILVYLFVLIQMGKIQGIWIPHEEIILIQKMGLASTLLLAGTFFFHTTKIVTSKNITEKFPLYILAWALNELVVIIAFAGSILSDSGNGFFMVVNSTLAILANILMFPKEK